MNNAVTAITRLGEYRLNLPLSAIDVVGEIMIEFEPDLWPLFMHGLLLQDLCANFAPG
jgi:hypothetical protein